jgi:UDP-glucose:(heptosyl)LPS alpha-1,3-glucosyltransferase
VNIALAIENFSPHSGGAESYAVDLARTLVSEGWEVHLFGHSWDGQPEQAHFHPIPRLPRWAPPSMKIVDFALRHRRMVAEHKFDVVLGFGNTVEMNVYQSHGGVHAISNLRKLDAVRNPLLRFIKRLALLVTPKYHARAWIESAPFRLHRRPVVVAISDMVRDDMATYFHLDKDDIRLVYNGINQARFSAPKSSESSLREKLGFREEVLFLFMAYDFKKKGVGYLVEAAGELKERVGEGRFGVVVVGRPPSPDLNRLVDRFGLHDTVVFPGPTKAPETFYQACDVFVLPTFYDACSLVVFEAMAAGLPAITTRNNGAAGIIHDGVDGLILKNPRDVEETAEAMERFLDAELLVTAGEAARRTAARYTLERNHRAMLDIFQEVARDSAASS